MTAMPPVFLEYKQRARELLKEYNSLEYNQKARKTELLTELFEGIGTNVYITPSCLAQGQIDAGLEAGERGIFLKNLCTSDHDRKWMLD